MDYKIIIRLHDEYMRYKDRWRRTTSSVVPYTITMHRIYLFETTQKTRRDVKTKWKEESEMKWTSEKYEVI
jgi:hypothetical protein